MAFSITLFVISWICFAIFADKSKFHLFYPTCLLAIYLSCAVDFFATEHYILWDYPQGTKIQTYFYHLLQQLGVYPVVTYLYLQNLPKQDKNGALILHIFYWSILAFCIEWLAINSGYMKHVKWWSLGCSYIADWILYYIFYRHHKWREKWRV